MTLVNLCLPLLTTLLLGAAAGTQSDASRRAASGQQPPTTTTVVASKSPFTQTCDNPSYPSPAPLTPPGIDSQCGHAGSGGLEAEQDSAKNDFCASGTPQQITVADLVGLQAQVQKNPAINFGDLNSADRKRGPTTDRTPLRQLGEGKLVTLRAFVLLARQEGGESVNCGKNVPNTPPFHDIHISLVATVPTATTQECSGVVGEMSPHHRPDAWTQRNLMKVAAARAPVRVTGHLFFDSSHVPCAAGQGVRSNPRRASLWEIHPIYKFEVCASGCDGAGTWLPLDQWAQQK